MTQREKSLAGAMGAALLAVGGFTAVRSLVLGPFNKLEADTKNAEIERGKLATYLRDEDKWDDEWTKVGGRTLHGDPKHALQMFREDIHNLLKRHRLTGKVPISPGPPAFNRKTGWTELSMSISVTGSVKEMVDMLRDLYRRPYAMQVRTLKIDAGEGKLKKGESSKPITLSMKIATLVLPETIEGVTIEPFGDLAAISDKVDETRLAMAASEYDEIAAKNIFQPGNGNPPPPPPPPPPTTTLKVIASVSLDGQTAIYVQNARRLENPPDEYRVDDDIKHEGTVILIRPDGMVVRDSHRSERKGGPATETDYYYPIGETFTQRQKVSRTTHPEIYAEIQQLASNR